MSPRLIMNLRPDSVVAMEMDYEANLGADRGERSSFTSESLESHRDRLKVWILSRSGQESVNNVDRSLLWGRVLIST